MSYITDTSSQLSATTTDLNNTINNIGVNYLPYMTSNSITNVLLPYDTIGLRNVALSSYTNTANMNTALSGKENNLTFNAPLTRATNTISLDLSSYTTTTSLNTALSSYSTTSTISSTYFSSNSTTDVLGFYTPINNPTINGRLKVKSNNNTSISIIDNVGKNPCLYFIRGVSDNYGEDSSIDAKLSCEGLGTLNFYTKTSIEGETNPLTINSGSIVANVLFTANNISSTGLDAKYFSSNSTTDNLSFFISSNILSKQDFINSNSISLNYLNRNGGFLTGNLGIGTTNPLYKLDIPTNGTTNQQILNFKNNSGYGIYATSTNIGSRGNTIDFKANDYNSGTITVRDVLSLRPEGNVGIGSGILYFGSRVQDYLIDLYGGTYGIGINASTLRFNSSSAYKFYAGTTNTFTIDGSGNVSVVGTLTANTISSTGLTASLATKEAVLTFSSPLIRTGNTISLDTNLSGLSSNQLASQQFINSNSISLNYIKKYVNNSIDVNTIAITGGSANYDGGSVDATNKTNTFISFKDAGASTDWCYLRQIGGTNAYKLALDFCDDGNDARFCIRNNLSTANPDTITEVFTVDNGNVSATGNLSISGTASITGTLTANSISSTGLTASLATKEAVLTFSNPLIRTGNTISLDTNLSGLSSNQLASQQFINSNSVSLNYLQKSAGGYVGIGTTKGNISLDAWGTNNMIGRAFITGTCHEANKRDVFSVGRLDGTTNEYCGIKCNVVTASTVGETYDNQSFINFWTWGNSVSGTREVMRINQRGRVGIGSTLPTHPLDVNGEIRCNTNILSHIGGTNGYMMMSPGNSTVTGYNGFYNAAGTRMGYIGNVAANGYIQLQSESTCVGYSINGVLSFGSRTQDYLIKLYGDDYGFGINGGTLRYNVPSSCYHRFYTGTTNTVTIDGSGNLSNTGNCDFGGTIAITGANANYDFGSSVDTANKTNTFISFKEGGTGSDWAYLRQIGATNAYKLALDFCDDGNDARFCIRNNKSTDNPDTITEVFTVDNGNVNATGTLTIAGATTLSSTLNVSGVATLSSTLNVSGQANITGRTSITSYLNVDSYITTASYIQMPNNNYFYGGNNVMKRQGLYLNGIYGGGYYFNTIDYSAYVSSEGGTEYCFRITCYNVDTDIPSACLQCYHVWLRNNGGAYTSYATIIGQTAGCGIQIGTTNTNLALTYPNSTAGAGLKHIIFENIAWTSV